MIEEAIASPTPAPLRRVLVVDDHVDSAMALAGLLQLMGHAVEVSFDGHDALRKTREHEPDCVLLDFQMPGLDGLSVARSVRKLPLAAQPLIVATTACGRAYDRMLSDEAGIDVHLVKPIDIDTLEKVLSAEFQPQRGSVLV